MKNNLFLKILLVLILLCLMVLIFRPKQDSPNYNYEDLNNKITQLEKQIYELKLSPSTNSNLLLVTEAIIKDLERIQSNLTEFTITYNKTIDNYNSQFQKIANEFQRISDSLNNHYRMILNLQQQILYK